ncbi:hypothetical protein AB0N14_13475 [Streptomyces sp. NPDC051104]|uniref:hypothetical protein n=1 Tax=Streptomyces sp. NPDC051104 TaxID=3155044 RepID=UPI0034133C02
MSDTITMRHPTLPSDQEIEVPRDAMPHYTAAGWQQVPAEELEKRAAAKAKTEAEAAAAEEEAGREPQAADEPEQSEPAESTERPARSRARHEKKGE